MAWQHGKYYVRSERVGKRVLTQYIGTGDHAELIAEMDDARRTARLLEQIEARDRRQELLDLARPPAELVAYGAQVQRVVADVLTALGFHQHKRQWRYRRMTDDGPLTRAIAIFRKDKLSDAELGELRTLANAHTSVASLGDLGGQAESMLISGYKEHPAFFALVDEKRRLLRDQLGWADASELERLLIREVVLCWVDYYRITSVYAQNTREFKASMMVVWEKILTSKQRRYLRAVEALVRTRRLLKLPAVQVNVALAGGQQVNISDQRSVIDH